MTKRVTKKQAGRPPQIPTELFKYDFTALAKGEKDARLHVKFLALGQIKAGRGYREVAGLYGVHETTVKKWVKKIVEGGVAALKDKPGRGRKSKLQNEQVADFKAAVNTMQDKRKGGRINVADITKMVHEQFGLVYAIKSMYNVLHRINFVWITARSKHPAHNPVAQEAFKKTSQIR